MKQSEAFKMALYLQEIKSDFVSVGVHPWSNGGYCVRLTDTDNGVILEQGNVSTPRRVRNLVVFAMNGVI